jgi:hypothetical protein
MMTEQGTGVWPRYATAETQTRFAEGLSVFFPAYNDAPSLPGLLERTFETLRRVAVDYEVIVVNDGSADNTGEILEQLRLEYAPFLRVVTHPENLGYGAALRSGLAAATKEFIFYTDGDSQYDPAELEKLLAAVEPDTGLVNGYKMERSDPWHRIAIGWLYNRFARWLFRIGVRDIDCDFRLIRRSALDLGALRCTGGTICVELVRTLELSGAKVAEVPVHHYARQYGRSQFFRIQSLLVTFFQLWSTFFRLVLLPSLTGANGPDGDTPTRISRRWIVLASLTVTILSIAAYFRALQIPFISDDYLQIQLSRDYGSFSSWGALAGDALYRCRATSIVFTYWLDKLVGLEPWYYNAASLLLHIVNSLLVLALGTWRPIGWKVATLAACFFAICQRHSEAVVWFSAIPELLMFFFALASFLFWVRWLEGRSMQGLCYAAAFACYLLALLSKESAVAVVPLCGLAVLFNPGTPLKRLWGLVPFSAIAAAYFLLDYLGRDANQHYRDGTFSLSAPFAGTLLRSFAGLLWVWGVAAIPLLFTKEARRWRSTVTFACVWIVISLFPYSFLTYMPRVPSRHTYLASVGSALIVAVGILSFRSWSRKWNLAWPVPAVAALIIIHQCGYLWTVKQYQYSERARPTEQLIRLAGEPKKEIRAKCFPFSSNIAELALQLRLGEGFRPEFLTGPEAARQPDAVDFCNANADGVHY